MNLLEAMRLSFTKKRDGALARQSTASVPVVVFMFLLFLMAATVMRETTLNVQRAEGVPQTPRMRLQRTQDMAFV